MKIFEQVYKNQKDNVNKVFVNPKSTLVSKIKNNTVSIFDKFISNINFIPKDSTALVIHIDKIELSETNILVATLECEFVGSTVPPIRRSYELYSELHGTIFKLNTDDAEQSVDYADKHEIPTAYILVDNIGKITFEELFDAEFSLEFPLNKYFL